MDYTRLGSTGVTVSRLCLGMMTYGVKTSREWALEEDEARPFIKKSLRPRLHLLRYRRRLFQRRQRGDHRQGAEGFRPGARQLRAGHQGLRRHGREPQPARPVAQAHHGGDRRLAHPARHGLCRPLPDPSLRSGDADGGDAGGADRRGQGRQGALYRRLVHVCLAVRADAGDLRPSRLQPLRHHAEPLQPALPRGGARDDPALPQGGHRADPVEPARRAGC